MHLTKLVVCMAALVTKICFAGLTIEPSKQDEGRLVAATIDILESCYTDRFSTVGLAGPSARSIITKVSPKNPFSVTLIDETSKEKNHNPINRALRYKLQVFVITLTDPNTLVRTLTQVKNTKWWNHMATFLIISLREIENGCSDAYDILWEAWKMDLLNAKFVCLNRRRGILIYTFNPYTSLAPVPWQQGTTYKGIGGHIWTMFVREYSEDESLCDRLDFDKTVDLGGYEIRASIDGSEDWRHADPNKKPTLVSRVNNITAQFLITSLNATWKLLLEAANDLKLKDSETGKIYNAGSNVASGINDIYFNLVMQHVFPEREITYPLSETRLVLLTQYRGYKSQLDKFISVLDKKSRFGVLVVLMITLLFFKCCLSKPLIPAILDLVLIMCNAVIRKIPAKLAPRIYLVTLFIFMITIQGIYQGKLASLLTKHVRLPNINSMEDLAQSNHTIYGSSFYRTYFNLSAFDGRYFEVTYHDNCTDAVLRSSNAACANTKIRLTGAAAKYKLHVSEKSMGTIYAVYLIRPNWPLEERVNVNYGRAASGGIIDHLHSRESDREIVTVKSYENQEQEPTVRVLTLEHLAFAFVILGIGLTCATITFIIEVAFCDTAIANIRSRIPRRIRLKK